MMQDADNRAAMEDLFACTETAAGGFWRTLYAAAEQAGDDALVAAQQRRRGTRRNQPFYRARHHRFLLWKKIRMA